MEKQVKSLRTLKEEQSKLQLVTQELEMSKSDIVQLKADANKNAALAASQDGLRKRLRKTTADVTSATAEAKDP